MYRCAGKHVKSQVACLLHSEAPKIYLNFMDTQIQACGCDSGLLAIANATALAHMDDPGKLFYDQKKMRQHLFQCLEKKSSHISLWRKREELWEKYLRQLILMFTAFVDCQRVHF